MNKKFTKISSLLLTSTVLTAPFVASAYEEVPEGGGYTLSSILNNLNDAVLLIGGAVATIMFVYAGIMFLIANGDATKVQTARHAVMWGAVGVAVMILASGVITFVQSFMG